ncbi:MAG: proline--tRNA ligase [Planctomycetota bacterium]
MAKPPKNAISPTRAEDYPEWYQQVIRAAELAEPAPTRGCMVIKPDGYALWENMQRTLDDAFKATGHRNAYFPLMIPLSYFEKEAEHVEGFAKECAVVTHHRLEPDGDGGLAPAGKLEEPMVIRPTSEMIIGDVYANWVQSYRDLPIKLNQWANVVRWEMRTRMFLRTAEFLWQEGHTVHATEGEALEETLQMLEVYRDFAESYMAMPVVTGEKTPDERFPGAVHTYTIEAMMQDGKALQAGTSHFLGQNFSRAQNIKFQDKDETEKFAWTTSWGVSTRLIGGLIMTHADDDGMVVPPKLASTHVVILPIYKSDDERAEVLEYAESLKGELRAKTFDGKPLAVEIDDRDLRGGEKKWQHVKRGVPLRVEVGPKDIAKNGVFVGRRDAGKSVGTGRDEFLATAADTLAEIQGGLFDRAAAFRAEKTHEVDSLDAVKDLFAGERTAFARVPIGQSEEATAFLKQHKLTRRCVPSDSHDGGPCVVTGEPVAKRVLVAKAY